MTTFYSVAFPARLQLRLLTDEASGKLLILLTEEIAFSSVALESLGLTHREAEVLRWLALGKTNSEIAILCDISERTVHKHLEHVYQKLGVETRIAAMQQALALKASQ